MRFLVKLCLILLVFGAAATASITPIRQYWKERNRPQFRHAEVDRGTIVSVVNSTGTIQPVLSVQIGSFVSGPITKLHVDFNDEVAEEEVLAEIDPRIYEAAVARDKAGMATARADVERAVALSQRAQNDEKRALALRSDNPDFISDSELDQFRFNRRSLDAQIRVAEATVKQAEANLRNSLANLEYTKIRSPVSGIIIDRKIDPGQTLAAQFQTPVLFVVAPEMRKQIHVFASVNESEIGMIRTAQERGQKAKFTVDAYPDDLFDGNISQIRMSSTTTQNVVTYPVVIKSPNPELKLLPGMTANVTFESKRKEDTVRIPNAALRFFPDRELVRDEDRGLLDGSEFAQREDEDVERVEPPSISAHQRVDAVRDRNRRHVWVAEEDRLRAIEVVTGINDGKFTDLVSGELEEGQQLVTGIKSK